MKKFFFIAVAVVAMAACAKTEVNPVAENNAISFQTATAVTKVTGSVFPQDQTFQEFKTRSEQELKKASVPRNQKQDPSAA